MRMLHVVPGLDYPANGIAVSAKLIADEQSADIVDVCDFYRITYLSEYNEVWVHSCWLPATLKACWRVLKARKPLVRMTHANLDAIRLQYHGWKKCFVGPIERYFLRKASRIVATCEAEKGWIQAYLGKKCPEIEVVDLKRFFKLNHEIREIHEKGKLHLLYLGRRHPLKGVEYLERAVKELVSGGVGEWRSGVELKIVNNAFGEEKEKVWEWCDVLVLPTLSENFGLVVAEALERGKRVITTDGAPAWGDGSLEFRVSSLELEKGEIWSGYGGRLLYLKGYRDGTREIRVELLKKAIMKFRV